VWSFDGDSQKENADRDFASNRGEAISNFGEPPILSS
jgi:hypothetical protein